MPCIHPSRRAHPSTSAQERAPQILSGGKVSQPLRLPDPLQYAHIIGDRVAAHIENPAELAVRLLHVTPLAAELHGGEVMHRHTGGTDRGAFSLASPLALAPAG